MDMGVVPIMLTRANELLRVVYQLAIVCVRNLFRTTYSPVINKIILHEVR